MLNQVTAYNDHCSIAFDIDEQRCLFVSDNFCDVLGIDAGHLQQNTDFLEGIVAPPVFTNLQQLTRKLTGGEHIQVTYRLDTNNKQLTECRRLIIDAITGTGF